MLFWGGGKGVGVGGYDKNADGMANRADPDQTAPRSSLIWVCTFYACMSVWIFRACMVVAKDTMSGKSFQIVGNYILSKVTKIIELCQWKAWGTPMCKQLNTQINLLKCIFLSLSSVVFQRQSSYLIEYSSA